MLDKFNGIFDLVFGVGKSLQSFRIDLFRTRNDLFRTWNACQVYWNFNRLLFIWIFLCYLLYFLHYLIERVHICLGNWTLVSSILELHSWIFPDVGSYIFKLISFEWTRESIDDRWHFPFHLFKNTLRATKWLEQYCSFSCVCCPLESALSQRQVDAVTSDLFFSFNQVCTVTRQSMRVTQRHARMAECVWEWLGAASNATAPVATLADIVKTSTWILSHQHPVASAQKKFTASLVGWWPCWFCFCVVELLKTEVEESFCSHRRLVTVL